MLTMRPGGGGGASGVPAVQSRCRRAARQPPALKYVTCQRARAHTSRDAGRVHAHVHVVGASCGVTKRHSWALFDSVRMRTAQLRAAGSGDAVRQWSRLTARLCGMEQVALHDGRSAPVLCSVVRSAVARFAGILFVFVFVFVSVATPTRTARTAHAERRNGLGCVQYILCAQLIPIHVWTASALRAFAPPRRAPPSGYYK